MNTPAATCRDFVDSFREHAHAARLVVVCDRVLNERNERDLDLVLHAPERPFDELAQSFPLRLMGDAAAAKGGGGQTYGSTGPTMSAQRG